MERHLLQTHIRSYEMGELVGRDLAKTFEASDLWIRAKITDSLLSLLVAIAIDGHEV